MAGKPKHGFSYAPEYKAWQTMRLRCFNPDNQAYPSYGGRGITVCDRWANSVENFMEDMGKKPSPKHEIDRIDNDGNYEPDNCRWATRSRNDRNRRSTQFVTIDGKEHCLIDLCESVGIMPTTVRKRLLAGWPLKKAIYTPARGKAPNGTRAKEENR